MNLNCFFCHSRSLYVRTLICVAAASLCIDVALSAHVHASVVSQGRQPQGTQVQGTQAATEVVGSPWVDEWLHGPILVGVLRGRQQPRETSATALLHLLGFQGDRIDASVWTRDTGWTRQVLHPRDVVGMQWLEYRCDAEISCSQMIFQINAAIMDSLQSTMKSGDTGELWLFDVSYRDANAGDRHDWKPVCRPDREGHSRGLFLTGRWRGDGARLSSGYTFACTSGVLAKCARNFGYRPWQKRTAADGALVALQPLHAACVRAARADYCGDGTSYTRDNTMIDMADTYGFNRHEPGSAYELEASFGEHGATRIWRTRWPIAGHTGNGKREFSCPQTQSTPRSIPPAKRDTLITVRRQARR